LAKGVFWSAEAPFALLVGTNGVCAMKKFSTEELAHYNGKNGGLAYIAYDAKVYDVSGSSLWRNGNHQFRHHAGRDLTGGLRQAPHGQDMLERVPVIGTLQEE
jgi:predicted heme/steroid binding protein